MSDGSIAEPFDDPMAVSAMEQSLGSEYSLAVAHTIGALRENVRGRQPLTTRSPEDAYYKYTIGLSDPPLDEIKITPVTKFQTTRTGVDFFLAYSENTPESISGAAANTEKSLFGAYLPDHDLFMPIAGFWAMEGAEYSTSSARAVFYDGDVALGLDNKISCRMDEDNLTLLGRPVEEGQEPWIVAREGLSLIQAAAESGDDDPSKVDDLVVGLGLEQTINSILRLNPERDYSREEALLRRLGSQALRGSFSILMSGKRNGQPFNYRLNAQISSPVNERSTDGARSSRAGRKIPRLFPKSSQPEYVSHLPLVVSVDQETRNPATSKWEAPVHRPDLDAETDSLGRFYPRVSLTTGEQETTPQLANVFSAERRTVFDFKSLNNIVFPLDRDSKEYEELKYLKECCSDAYPDLLINTFRNFLKDRVDWSSLQPGDIQVFLDEIGRIKHDNPDFNTHTRNSSSNFSIYPIITIMTERIRENLGLEEDEKLDIGDLVLPNGVSIDHFMIYTNRIKVRVIEGETPLSGYPFAGSYLVTGDVKIVSKKGKVRKLRGMRKYEEGKISELRRMARDFFDSFIP
jgi:hypothetical protein